MGGVWMNSHSEANASMLLWSGSDCGGEDQFSRVGSKGGHILRSRHRITLNVGQ